jgi:hypothetical protein
MEKSVYLCAPKSGAAGLTRRRKEYRLEFFLKEIIKKVWLIKKSINFALPKRREGVKRGD